MESQPDVEAQSAAESNPHVLWRQLFGLVCWVAIPAFALAGPLGMLPGLALGGATFADAWTSGIYKNPSKKSFLNISPMGWGVAMVMLFIVAFPVYLANRNKLRTKDAGNGFFFAVIVFGIGLIGLLIVNAASVGA